MENPVRLQESESASSVAQERLRRLQVLTDSNLALLTVEALLDELLNRIRDLLGADTAAVLLLDEENAELVATAAKGIEEEVEQGVRLPVGGGFAGKIAASAQPVILDEVDHNKVLNPLLLKRGIRSLLGVPLIVDGKVTGVLHVGTLSLRKFNKDDVALLQLVADRVALAVNAHRQQAHRAIAETLQRSLLPSRFPQVRGFEIAGYYRPAQGGLVGGDWYDVFALGDQGLCVVVGDIAGHGFPAAVSMARIRNAVRAVFFIEKEPARTMIRLNEFVANFEPGIIATMLVGLIGLSGKMSYASAGHLPPLVVDRRGEGRFIEEDAEPPIGSLDFFQYRSRYLELENDSTLVLYTDGLVERRGLSLATGLETLRQAAEVPWNTVEALCARVLEGQWQDPRLEDDIALLAIRTSLDFPTLEFAINIQADPRELASLRRTLRRLLAQCGSSELEAQDVLVSVGEAVANAIEHAHSPGVGLIRIQARVRDDTFTAIVRDHGSWRVPRGTNRGRGRLLMEALMDKVVYDVTESGTEVTLSKRLGSSK